MVFLIAVAAAAPLGGYRATESAEDVWVVDDAFRLEPAQLDGHWRMWDSSPGYGQVSQGGRTRLVPQERLVHHIDPSGGVALRLGGPLRPEADVEVSVVSFTSRWSTLAHTDYLEVDGRMVPGAELLQAAARWPGATVFAQQSQEVAWVGVAVGDSVASVWVPLFGTLREVTVLSEATLPGAEALFVVHSSNSSCPSTSLCTLVAWTGDRAEVVRSVHASGEVGWYDDTSLFLPTRQGGWTSLEGQPLPLSAPVSPADGYMVELVESGEPDEENATEDELRSRVTFRDVRVVPWLPEAP